MTSGDGNRDLQGRFAALRAEEARAAPGFAHIRARRAIAPPYRRGRILAMAGTAGALVVTGLLLLLEREPSGTPGLDAGRLSITQWKSPTDFLLRTSAGPLLQASPAVGERWLMGPFASPAVTPAPSRGRPDGSDGGR